MTNFTYSDELYHFGVKGMRWGIRRYQNPDGTLTEEGRKRYGYSENVIPKGTTLYRTSANSKESFEKGSTYVSIDDADRNYYKGGPGSYWLKDVATLNNAYSGKLYEYELKLKSDVKLAQKQDILDAIESIKGPARKEMMKAGLEVYKEFANKSIEQELYWDRREYVQRIQADDPDIFKDKDRAPEKWKEIDAKYERMLKDGYKKVAKDYENLPLEEAFDKGIARSFGRNEKIRNMVVEELKSKGYNAMIDQASIGAKNKWDGYYVVEGNAPLIVFDRSTIEATKVSEITKKDALKADKNYYRWQNKATKEAEKAGHYK